MDLRAAAVLVALALTACTAPGAVADLDVSLQRTRAASGYGANNFVSTHVQVTSSSGSSVACEDVDVAATVRVSFDDGDTWSTVSSGDVDVRCAVGSGDLALVLDNSGSTSDVITELSSAATHLTDPVLDAGGRASWVRVSTQASILAELSDDPDDRDDALDALISGSKGWTALYDGVRLANQTLGKDRADLEAFRDLGRFCDAADRLGIVVFTDGAENNSDDSQDYDHTRYPGDGYDTNLDDVLGLHVGGQTTPIYTVGMGDAADHDALAALSGATGGRHKAIETEDEIEDAFSVISDYLDAGHQVCAQLSTSDCGAAVVEVSWVATDADGAEIGSGTVSQGVYMDCPLPAPQGKHATVLMTLSNPRIAKADATTLAVNAVEAVTPVAEPRVLVVLDDNHHNEFKGDADYIAGLLEDEGYSVTRLDERKTGLTATDVAGFDVVWFSNPGYPVDDKASMDALTVFSAAGGGLVLQGDDMSQAAGGAFSMTGMTGLDFKDNGTRRCGVKTDNNSGKDLEVEFDAGSHPLNVGLASAVWRYGDDIDIVEVSSGASSAVSVAATADLSYACSAGPAVVLYEP